MKRKQQLSSLLLLIGLAGTYTANAQTPAGQAPGGPVAFAGLRSPQPSGIVALTTVSGTIRQFTTNDESVLDGFVLNTDSKTVAVQFSPHLGQAIQAAGKQGSQVTVTGSSAITPEGETVFRLASLTTGKTVVSDTAPAVPATPPTPTLITVTGKVIDHQLDRQGQINGLRLSDQSLIRVPPHMAAQLMTIAPKKSTVSVEGYSRPVGEGQVQLKKQTVVDASRITVNGQSFLLR